MRLCTVLLIRDSTQVKLARVNDLIKRLEDNFVVGVSSSSKELINAVADERAAIKEELKCGNNDRRITPRLIDALEHAATANLGVLNADGMKSHNCHTPRQQYMIFSQLSRPRQQLA